MALKQIDSLLIAEERRRGVFIGFELTESARPVAEALVTNEKIVTKVTHGTTLRIAPAFYRLLQTVEASASS